MTTRHSVSGGDCPDEPAQREQSDASALEGAGPVGPARRRVRRRVRTQPVPGSDPHPTPEPHRHGEGENDEQLKRDVPPHWGSD